MNPAAWTSLGAAGAFAALDWYAVIERRKRLEFVCKPATMLALIAAAVALVPHSETRRWAFVAALVFSLAGDVFLMLPDRFRQGLIAFFVAHVAYIVGLRVEQPRLGPLLVSALVVFVAIAFVGRRILDGVRSTDPRLATPVSAYIAVIAVMGASALASGLPLAATAAVLFMASDTLIAWNRFVRPLGWAPVTIIVTYHVAQAGFVLALGL